MPSVTPLLIICSSPACQGSPTRAEGRHLMHLSRASVAAVPACLAVVAGCAARLRTRASRRSGSRRPSRGAKALYSGGTNNRRTDAVRFRRRCGLPPGPEPDRRPRGARSCGVGSLSRAARGRCIRAATVRFVRESSAQQSLPEADTVEPPALSRSMQPARSSQCATARQSRPGEWPVADSIGVPATTMNHCPSTSPPTPSVATITSRCCPRKHQSSDEMVNRGWPVRPLPRGAHCSWRRRT
jgi:hypothetical protein